MEPNQCLTSYCGVNKEEQLANKAKCDTLRASLSEAMGALPKPAEICGKKQDVTMALSLFGVKLRSKQEALNFCDDVNRARIMKRVQTCYKQWTKSGLHPDKHVGWIEYEPMKQYFDFLFSHVTDSLKAIKEWCSLAEDPPSRVRKTSHLTNWSKGLVSWSNRRRGGAVWYEEIEAARNQ